MSNMIQEWMGEDFFALHPLLQEIYREGATLSGQVEVMLPKTGFQRYFGKQLAKRIGMPSEQGHYDFSVNISQIHNALILEHNFNQEKKMVSILNAVGIKESGFLLEENGLFKMRLTVDIKNGQWHWRWLDVKGPARSFAQFIFPYSVAKQVINANGDVEWFVSYHLLGFGKILGYKGVLKKTSFQTNN